MEILVFLMIITVAEGTLSNVALRKDVSSCSGGASFALQRAVDGNLSTNFYQFNSGCIQIDLKQFYTIEYILLRTEDEEGNLRVHVEISPPHKICKRTIKSALSFQYYDTIQKFDCFKQMARYVRVEGKDKLKIGELEVYADVHSSHINIALKKEAIMVTDAGDKPGGKCVDGVMKTCFEGDSKWLVVDMKESRNIRSIHLYSSEGKTSKVEVSKKRQAGNSIECHVKERENYKTVYSCDENESRYILITNTNGLKEVEAFSLKTDWMDDYVGCYGETETMKLMSDDLGDVETCMILCRSNRQLLAFIQQNKCYCDSTLPSISVVSSSCASKCRADQNPCGGAHHFSVYQSRYLKYEGCFRNKYQDLILKGDEILKKLDNNTIELCWETCSKLGHKYFGLEYKTYCYCGDYEVKRVVSTECSLRCTGNSREFCGGLDAIDIYEACSNFTHHLNSCSTNALHCKEESDQGTCEKGCKPGWQGPQCSRRKCSENNGDCGSHRCVELPFGSKVMSECVCNKGFFKNHYTAFCEVQEDKNRGSYLYVIVAIVAGLVVGILIITILFFARYKERLPTPKQIYIAS